MFLILCNCIQYTFVKRDVIFLINQIKLYLILIFTLIMISLFQPIVICKYMSAQVPLVSYIPVPVLFKHT